MTEDVKPNTEAEPALRRTRGKARQPSPESVATITSLLPRNKMAVTDGTPAAADIEAAVVKKRAADEMLYTKLIAAGAEHAEPADVARVMGWSLAALEAFLAEHRQFAADRYEKVRKRHSVALAAEPSPAADFIWTDAKRRRLLEKYVDRGDLLEAQEHVGCTPSQFNRERDSNPEFARLFKTAAKEARETLKLRATSDALGGNDKLLSVFVKDLENGKSDDLSKLTDAQLTAQINSLLKQIRVECIENGETPLEVYKGDIVIGSDITFLLQVAATALKSTGSHEGAAASIGRTVAEFDEFLKGCAQAGLDTEVAAYRSARAQLDPPKPAATSLAAAESGADARRVAWQQGMEQRMQAPTTPNSTDIPKGS